MPKESVFSRREIAVLLLVVALVASLASRVVHLSYSDQPTAHSTLSQQKIQHRDNDAGGWAAPDAQLSILWVTEASLVPETREPVYVPFQYDSLYNRPPPLA